MDFFYNWQQHYPQYSSNLNVNQYFNNSYEYLHTQQQSNKNGFYNWNNYIPSSQSNSTFNNMSSFSTVQSPPKTQPVTQTNTKIGLIPSNLSYSNSGPVTFQPSKFYDGYSFQKAKKKTQNTLESNNYNQTKSNNRSLNHQDEILSSSYQSFSKIYEKHNNSYKKKIKQNEPIYSNNINLKNSFSKQNKKSATTKQQDGLKNVPSVDSVIDTNKKQPLNTSVIIKSNIMSKTNDKTKKNLMTPNSSYQKDKLIFQTKPKIRELHIGAKEKSTKKLIDPTKKIDNLETSNILQQIKANINPAFSKSDSSDSTLTNIEQKVSPLYDNNYKIKFPSTKPLANNIVNKPIFYMNNPKDLKKNKPIFRPPDINELLKPTIRGVPDRLLNNSPLHINKKPEKSVSGLNLNKKIGKENKKITSNNSNLNLKQKASSFEIIDEKSTSTDNLQLQSNKHLIPLK